MNKKIFQIISASAFAAIICVCGLEVKAEKPETCLNKHTYGECSTCCFTGVTHCLMKAKSKAEQAACTTTWRSGCIEECKKK